MNRGSSAVPWICASANDQRRRPVYYITTAIAYPNGAPHIGHAYEAIATDAIARFMRLDGYDVSSSPAPTSTAMKMLADRRARGHHAARAGRAQRAALPAMVERLNCSNDDFIRTTEERHHRGIAGDLASGWRRNGDIYLGKYSGWYSVRDEAYYDEDETTPTRTAARRPARHAGRMGRGGELLLPALRLSGQAARPLRRASRLRAAEGAAATRSRAS